MRQFRTSNRNQLLLMPPNLNDWLPADHEARFVVDFVEKLDLRQFYDVYDTGKGGQPPYDPAVMLGILLYAHMCGRTSSRVIERCLSEDIGFRFIAGNLRPDHDTIADFRKRHRHALESVFTAGVRLAVKGGLVALKHVAVDGTKIRANAAKGKRKTGEALEVESKRIKSLVQSYLDECDEMDRREDEEFGKGNNGYFLPAHLRDEESRKKWIEEALAEIESESKDTKDEEPKDGPPPPPSTGQKKLIKKLKKLSAAKAALDEQTEQQRLDDPTGKKKRDRERKRGAAETPKVNVTDTDSRVMLFSNGKYDEGYNCQIAVDGEYGIILAADVTQDGGDQKQLLPMVLQTRSNTGWLPEYVSADNGYFNFEHMEDQRVNGVDFYVKPPKRGAREGEDTKSEAMREKLDSPLGRWLYQARSTVVEPVFGAIKHSRKVRQFLMRTKSAVRAEWYLWCTAHNLIKMFKAGLVPA